MRFKYVVLHGLEEDANVRALLHRYGEEEEEDRTSEKRKFQNSHKMHSKEVLSGHMGNLQSCKRKKNCDAFVFKESGQFSTCASSGRCEESDDKDWFRMLQIGNDGTLRVDAKC